MDRIVSLGARSYPLYIERGSLGALSPRVDLHRKVLLVTDDGVPEALVRTVLAQCPQGVLEVLPQGEGSKSFDAAQALCARMLRENFTRGDLALALGGGVIGDLTGFAASIYMRGIDYVGLPTTTLSQIDSSVGGKTAINFQGVKNIVGAFHQPRAVFLDADAFMTLPRRHFVNGLAEALKMGLILDPVILSLFEREDWESHVEEIVRRAVLAKADVVERDETEQGERKSLNFGHTIGHGIEAAAEMHGLLHGECVGLGMLYFIENEALRRRTLRILTRLGVPTRADVDPEKVYAALVHDKKGDGSGVRVVVVDAPGHYILRKMDYAALRARVFSGV